MSVRNLNFEATATGMENGKFKVTLLPNGDDRFLKYAFHFYDIELKFEDDGIGISYALNVDFASDHLPDTLSPERQIEIKEFGHKLIGKFMEDLVAIIDAGLDRNDKLQYNDLHCADHCTGACHENI
jgi:hypothetical protein